MKFKVGDKVIYKSMFGDALSPKPHNPEYEGVITGLSSGFDKNFGEYEITILNENGRILDQNRLAYESELSINKSATRDDILDKLLKKIF